MLLLIVVLSYAGLAIVALVAWINWDVAERELESQAREYEQEYKQLEQAYREYRARYFAILPYAPVVVREQGSSADRSADGSTEEDGVTKPRWEYPFAQSEPNLTPFDLPVTPGAIPLQIIN